MSTRRKEGAPPGKEKGGTSPSNAGSGTGGRRSPGPPKTNDSTPTGKSIPSYLKPTAASSSALSDASKTQSGKKKPTLTTDKATIERRRSFDKPPSPSRSTKSPVSLNPTLRSSSFSGKTINDPPGANVARRRSFDKPPSPSRSTKSPVSPSPTLRSSSFSGKTSATLNKGVSERNSKGPKDAGKQSTLHARPAASSVKKNSSVLTKKSEAGRGSLRKKQVESSPEKVEKPDVPEPEPEPQSEDQETFVVDEEQEYSLLEDEDVTNIIEQIEGESHDNDAVIESPTVTEQHDANIAVAESPTAIENQEDKVDPVEASTDLEHEDEEDRSRDEEIRNQQEDVKEETNHADDHDNNDESGAGDHNEEVEEKEREVDEENEEAIEVDNDRKSNEQLDENEAEEIVVEEKKEEAVVEEKKEEEDATPRVAHGKKDLTLSNDVIEETRNKLTEQRKNKVKALAGAFETVISLQDPK